MTNTESERFPLFDAMNHQPVMTIFAGPNGGGKSTLRDEWSLSHPLGTIIDVDFIARQHHLTDIEAGKKAIQLVEACIRDGVPFALETTLSGHLIFQQMIQAKKNRFQIHLLFVSLASPREHQKRVEQRVANGGHAIPAADIERRYFRSLTNLPKAIDLADHVHVFTNVSRYVLVCTIEQGRMVYKDRQSPKWLVDVIRQME